MHKQNYRYCSYKLKSLCEKRACRFSNNKPRKQWAFTLAEVLITLGIIGIVAAMTIPTLINNYQKKETVTRLQKVFTIISQAHKNAELEMGPSSSWSNPTIQMDTAASIVWWNEYILPYAKLSISKTCTPATISQCLSPFKFLNGSSGSSFGDFNYYILNDGTMLCFAGVRNAEGFIFVDLNGFKKPNTMGKDIFVIIDSYKAGKVTFYGQGAGRNWLLGSTNDGVSCKKDIGSGYACGALIQLDGWQIKDDYPWN